jgi:hypothetical protein
LNLQPSAASHPACELIMQWFARQAELPSRAGSLPGLNHTDDPCGSEPAREGARSDTTHRRAKHDP